jgi:hypothetical protein
LAENQKIKEESWKENAAGTQYRIQWEIDSTKFHHVDFKGFEGGSYK